jgi:hypothetical protein
LEALLPHRRNRLARLLSAFLLYAAAHRTGFLIIDYVNLIIHGGGHFFFSWFGHTIMILGGTLGEFLVPLLYTAYFWWKRETTAVAFSSFWFLENFPYIGTYMADARTSAFAAGRLGGKRLDDSFHSMGPAWKGPTNRRNDLRPRLAGHARHRRLARLAHLERRQSTGLIAPRSPFCCQVSTLNLTVFW